MQYVNLHQTRFGTKTYHCLTDLKIPSTSKSKQLLSFVHFTLKFSSYLNPLQDQQFEPQQIAK